MGPKQDFNSTFGRVFAQDVRAPGPPPPPRSGYSPFALPEAMPGKDVGDRQNFGVGFRRAPGTGAYSPQTRTTCVQDIILRDRGSSNSEPVRRYDLPPQRRDSATTAVTSTIPLESARPFPASPQAATRILPGLDAEQGQPMSRPSAASLQQSRVARRQRSLSPGLCQTPVHMKGSTVLEEKSPRASPSPRAPAFGASLAPASAASQQILVDALRPLTQTAPEFTRCTKKQFPDRKNLANGIEPQLLEPGTEAAEVVIIGDVAVPENLELRQEQDELSRKIQQRHAVRRDDVNEWQFRTREIVTMRSKERRAFRWN